MMPQEKYESSHSEGFQPHSEGVLTKRWANGQILILCQLFYPELVSTGQTLTELAEQMASCGIDVEVLCGPPTVLGRESKVPSRMEHKGIRIRRVWGTRFPKLSLLGRIVNQVTFTMSVFLHFLVHRCKRPILVLTNPPFLAVVCAVLRVLRLGPPFLYLIFDVYPDTAVRLGLLKEKALLCRVWDRLNLFVYDHASSIIVIGRCMEDVIRQKTAKMGRDVNGRLQRVHVWCDDAAITAASSSSNGFAQRFNVSNKVVVGYFGNMGRFHDIETIMAAAEGLKDDDNIVFLFVGEGHKKKWAMDYARRNGLANCRFHTYVAREDLGHLLALADIGLVSLLEQQVGLSVPSKAFGFMAAAVPVVAVVPKECEIARIIVEQECGVWVRPGDKDSLIHHLRELAANRTGLQTMGMNGQRAIREKYSLEKACIRYVELLAAIEE